MKELTYRTVDKSEWGEGPWQDEVDKMQWEDPATGLPCLIVRNRMGSWCGYVGVPEDHPTYNTSYDSIDVSVHGGLTYGDFCQHEAPEEAGICHIPEPGEPDNVFWHGFDCGHAGDYMPAMAAQMRSLPNYDGMWSEPYNHEEAVAANDWFVETYKTLDYVRAETTQLAAQLAELKNSRAERAWRWLRNGR